MGNFIKAKIRDEKLAGLILKLMLSVRYIFNYYCLKFLCKQVGKNVRVIEIPKITGGRNIWVGNDVFIGRGVHLTAPGNSRIKIGNGTEIRDAVRLYSGSIEIGSKVTCGENAFMLGDILIKDGCWISRGCDISGAVEIEKSILGPYVKCVSSDHGRGDDGAVLMDKTVSSKKIFIKEGAWIGTGAIVLKGVTVSKNVIVGAGSVVTKTAAEGSVIAGVPAREIDSGLKIDNTKNRL